MFVCGEGVDKTVNRRDVASLKNKVHKGTKCSIITLVFCAKVIFLWRSLNADTSFGGFI
jgi:hypothetical protein